MNSKITLSQLEQYLSKAAWILKGPVDASDFKVYIFPLLFFKRISDVYDDEYKQALEESKGDKEYAELPEFHRFVIPKKCHWNDVRSVTVNVGQALEKAFRGIEQSNQEHLYGIFGDAQWSNKNKLTDRLLIDLIEHFSQYNLSNSNVDPDLLGQAYEYLIKHFADLTNKKAGEFYTPRSVVHLMGLIVDSKEGESIYDPACGTGGMLLEAINHLKENDGSIKTYRVDEFNIDQITPGRAVLYLYQVTGDKKYKTAVDTLRHQLAFHPRTKSNGFWHKQIYPNQMWLDGLYMGEPFYSEYSREFDRVKDFDDIAHQFELMYEKARDPKTGLLYHAWDESKEQKWADPQTGLSPHFWGRSIGWYVMALVDVLDTFPKDHPKRQMLINQLKNISEALMKFRDKKSNVWYQVVDQGKRKGNYLEASASAMYVYAFAKGYNKGYLDKKYLLNAQLSFAGILKQFVTIDKEGLINLNHVCSVAGLGGKPYRNGSFEYYVSEKQRTNDFKGYGPFLLAAIEIEKAQKYAGSGVKVGLDNYFNNETRKNKKTGKEEKFHYIISDTTNSGFSDFAAIFKKVGSKISEIKSAPTSKILKPYSIYIIVDPDTPQETTNPKYIEEKDITAITNWVKNGGVLVLFANDKGNSEFEHLNNLAKQFGWHFNEVSLNRVEGNKYDMGAFVKLPVHPIFNSVNKIYMKEISTISVDAPQHIILKKDNDAAIAFKRFGNGAVLAIGDPWLYNEYIEHRKLPVDFENMKAAQNLVNWLFDLVYVINHSN